MDVYDKFKITENVIKCSSCPLHEEALKPVPGDLVQSKVLILGRNPGTTENDVGKPFVGRGGKILDEALKAANIDRTKVAITNLAKCYSTDDRPPDLAYYRTCHFKHFVHELDLLKPKYILALGNDVFRYITMMSESVTQCRQVYWNVRIPLNEPVVTFTPQEFQPVRLFETQVVGTLHPGSAARSYTWRVALQEDLQWFMRTISPDDANEITLKGQ